MCNSWLKHPKAENQALWALVGLNVKVKGFTLDNKVDAFNNFY